MRSVLSDILYSSIISESAVLTFGRNWQDKFE
jgi:hypothetical protein